MHNADANAAKMSFIIIEMGGSKGAWLKPLSSLSSWLSMANSSEMRQSTGIGPDFMFPGPQAAKQPNATLVLEPTQTPGHRSRRANSWLRASTRRLGSARNYIQDGKHEL